MKVENKKEIAKNEFRKNKESGHPSYVYAKEGNSYKHIGITHSSKTRNIQNIKLNKNPNPADKTTAYFIPQAEKDSVNNFKKKEVGWSLSKTDKEKIKPYKK